MTAPSANQALALAVVHGLRRRGVRTFCVCPGGRNAPFVEVLDALAPEHAEVLGFFDERSAAFFALGRARRDGNPVAVVTTSGTAAAEVLPAMVEATYACAPVIAVTADRPRASRGTGAPQTIDQVGLFGRYALASVDVERADEPWNLPDLDGPAHINVCFDEPLLAGWVRDEPGEPSWADGVSDAAAGGSPGHRVTAAAADRGVGAIGAGSGKRGAEPLREFLARVRAPLVIAGGLHTACDQEDALRFCQDLGAPVAAEASSGIRERLGGLRLRSADAAIQRGFARGLFDSVVRLGDVPSFRVWRDLDLALSVPVWSLSRKPWPGLTRGVHHRADRGDRLAAHLALPVRRTSLPSGVEALLAWDRRLAESADRCLAEHPTAEQAMIRRLSERIPDGSFVYLGNSLPIREWNQFATPAPKRFVHGENRGANGIDGQVSTFLGWASAGRENWAVVGDLTALYDLSSPWAARHVSGGPVRLVVVNNGGGRIFAPMFQNPRFQNLHEIGFEAWAVMWGFEYHAALPPGRVGPAALVELRPDRAETDAVSAALSREASR